MKILMTGITGFIGSHLAEHLILQGDEVWAIIRPNSDIDSLPRNVKNQTRFLINDKNNTLYNILENLTKSQSKPDLVYHLASLYISQHSAQDINNLIASNIKFGTNLLEAMTNQKIYNIVWAGTSWQHFENAKYNPVNLYAATKEAFDCIIKYYFETTKLKGICLKLFDTYGPADKRKKLMSLLIDAAISGTKIELSPGEQKIDLVYIDDVVKAFILAGKRLLDGKVLKSEEYGVSSKNAISIKELAQQIERITNKHLNIEWGKRPYRLREVMIPWSKFKTLTGWNPKICLEEGVCRMMIK